MKMGKHQGKTNESNSICKVILQNVISCLIFFFVVNLKVNGVNVN